MKKLMEKGKYLLIGIGEMALGIVSLMRPVGVAQGIVICQGAVLLISGLAQILSYFRTKPEKAALKRRLSLGLFAVTVGLCCIFCVDWIMEQDASLRYIYGILFFLAGAVKFQWTADFLRFGKYQWVFSGLGSAAAFIAAALLFLNPAWAADSLGMIAPLTWFAEAILDALAVFYKGSMSEPKKVQRKKKILDGAAWKFQKDCAQIPAEFPSEWESVTLPHTWNALDGQDGGNDYFRGRCAYVLRVPKQKTNGRVWLEIEAASMTADVYINGKQVMNHEGGYSAFRADVTDYLKKRKNLLCIFVDNSANDGIYPQMADFTFFGGLYRGVSLITVPESHFALDHFGADGFQCTPVIDEVGTRVRTEAWLENAENRDRVQFLVTDADGVVVARSEIAASGYMSAELHVPQPHFWQGVEDPYLYTATAKLLRDGEVVDELSVRIGIRTFKVYPEKGFFLNGKQMPLRGVSRHQDRQDKGYAVSTQDHLEDAALIREVGANTVRLAHYQHSRTFYDECDRLGLVVWAEIPLISVMSDSLKAHENSLQQMKELISQNYNHPSICFWGIANEITIGGETSEMEANLKELNRMVHDMDPVRLTTMAQFSSYPMDGALNRITDVVSYNHYFGWYAGSFEDNEKWLDTFHEKYPDRAIGLSEYGCEGIVNWHSDEPKRKDYTEEYQALYHEHMAQIIAERPWLWATHVWNMFDFAADGRDEGGVKGRNNKGLVTMDRKTKKDSFYLYKAWWSDEPFIHICGRRYAERAADTITVKVYSNLPEITLFVDGDLIEIKTGEKVFSFPDIPFAEGSHTITARYQEMEDTITLTRVRQENPAYHFDAGDDNGTVANWFEDKNLDEVPELTFGEGYFSIKDTVGDILANAQAKEVFLAAVSSMVGMKMDEATIGAMAAKTVEDLKGMLGAREGTDVQIAVLNAELQKVKKGEPVKGDT